VSSKYRVEYNKYKDKYRVCRLVMRLVRDDHITSWEPLTEIVSSYGGLYYSRDRSFDMANDAEDYIRKAEAEDLKMEQIRQLDQWKPI